MRLIRILLLPPLIAGGAALAGTGVSQQPRFEVSANGAGVTRIDTVTGAVSHCVESAGTWQCEPVSDGGTGQSSADIERLSAAVDALAVRVDALSARLDPPKLTTPPRSGPGAEVVARLLEMVRRLKHPHEAPVTPVAP